jgi:RNA ligase
MEKREAIERLQGFIRLMVHDGANSFQRVGLWKKANQTHMAEIFDYHQSGKMPPVNSLVQVAFHPEQPLILLNYSQVAHNTLHKFEGGWTEVLRLCRGIVFDTAGNLVALPFPKFFNYRKSPEPMVLPNEPCFASEKLDGHLGINFWFRDNLYITTRGYFDSPTSLLATKIQQELIEKNDWRHNFPKDFTVLVEIIHPETHVLTDYDWQGLKLIGVYNLKTLEDCSYIQMSFLADRLGIPVADVWKGHDLQDLISSMSDRTIQDREGYVVRFSSGLRVKLKFDTYIGKMVNAKMSYKYLMQRYVTGNLEEMLATTEEEVTDVAYKMLGEIMLKVSVPGTPTEKWRRLYELVPKEDRTGSFETACRDFVKFLSLGF